MWRDHRDVIYPHILIFKIIHDLLKKTKKQKKTPVYLYPCRSIVKWGEERSDPSDTTAD